MNQPLNLKTNIHICTNCNLTTKKALILDCRHHLCLLCLAAELDSNQNQEMLTDELLLVCSACKCVTYLSVSLAYKLTRQVVSQQNSLMLCMDCLDQLFTIEDYLSGLHKTHQVLGFENGFPLLKSHMQYTCKTLQQSTDHLQGQIQKLIQLKIALKGIFTNNLTTIQLQFQTLKEELNRKEEQCLNKYQQLLRDQFKLIEKDIEEIKNNIEKGENYQKSISDAAFPSNNHSSPKDKVASAKYFLKHHSEIIEITRFQQQIGSKISTHLQLLKQTKPSLNIDHFSKISNCIKTLQLSTNATPQSETNPHSSTLSHQYFNNKKQELHSPAENSKLFQQLSDKLQTNPVSQKLTHLNNLVKPKSALKSTKHR